MLLDNATGKRRHTPFLDFLANTNKTVNRLFGAFLSLPILKIHVSSDFVDVIRDYPRQRPYVAVPRPMGLAGMAISA
jgi:hypothetical protein